MKEEIMIKIRGLEKERDRCIAIKCTHVAAKFQRMIDKALKEMEEELYEKSVEYLGSKL